MENAVEALIMAGQVLIFIVALTVCISSFTTVRVGIDSLIDENETIALTKDPNSEDYINYIQSRDSGSIRVVGAETVVSSMYRALKENYVIYIKLYNTTGVFNGSTITPYKATQNLDVSGVNVITAEDKIIKITIGSNQQVNAILEAGFYDKIKGLHFNEYLGEYQNNSQANTEDKITYRIITYIDTQC